MNCLLAARRPMTLVAGVALLLGSAACAADSGGDGAIDVTGAWARTSPTMATRGAVYLQITNDSGVDDALIAASVDAAVAATVELHETVSTASDGGMSSGMDGEGMMEMRQVDRIEVAAGESVSLAPGGFHIMLLDLAEPLEAGASIDVTLTFEEAGEMEVSADVSDTAP
jgi:periplasmic copper chaperone A